MKSKCEQAVELIEAAKRNIESCMNLLDANEYQLEQAMKAMQNALAEIDGRQCILFNMLAKLYDTLRKLK